MLVESIEHLMEIASILSPSRQEGDMQEYICKWLDELDIPYVFDAYGNIITCQKNTPRKWGVCAHMDQVRTAYQTLRSTKDKKADPSRRLDILPEPVYENGVIYSNSRQACGWDDKAGIVVALSILSAVPDTPVIFTCEEEIGGNGSEEVEPSLWKNITWVVPDRREMHEILYEGSSHVYGPKAVSDLLCQTYFKGLQSSNKGSFSDADHISYHAPAYNFSVAYYNAHMPSEYLIVKGLQTRVMQLIDLFLSNDANEFSELAQHLHKPSSKYSYRNYGKGKYLLDGDDDEIDLIYDDDRKRLEALGFQFEDSHEIEEDDDDGVLANINYLTATDKQIEAAMAAFENSKKKTS